MGRRKNALLPDCFSMYPAGEKWVPSTHSLLYSNAFRSLNARQRVLYLYCALQKGKPGTVNEPGKDNPTVQEFQNDYVFYMNWKKVQEFKIYGEKSNHTFYNDIKALINAGFIECLYHGRQTRQKSVYKLSTRWRQEGMCKKQKGCVATTQGLCSNNTVQRKEENRKSPIKWAFSKNPEKNEAKMTVFPQHSAEMSKRPDKIEGNRLLPS